MFQSGTPHHARRSAERFERAARTGQGGIQRERLLILEARLWDVAEPFSYNAEVEVSGGTLIPQSDQSCERVPSALIVAGTHAGFCEIGLRPRLDGIELGGVRERGNRSLCV